MVGEGRLVVVEEGRLVVVVEEGRLVVVEDGGRRTIGGGGGRTMGGGPRRRRNPRGGTVPRRRRTPPEHISARLHPASSWRRRLETRTTRNFSGGASGCTARPASRRGAAVALPPLDPPPTQKSPSWGSAASPSWGSAASPSAASPIAWSMGDVLHGEVHLPDAAIRSSLQGQSEPRPTLHALPLERPQSLPRSGTGAPSS